MYVCLCVCVCVCARACRADQRYSSLLNELKEEITELNAMVETLTEEKVQLEARLLEEVR